MRDRTLYEIHVTNSKHVPLMDIPDLRGVDGWQNLLRRLFFLCGIESVQISKAQYRHFTKLSGDTNVNIYQY